MVRILLWSITFLFLEKVCPDPGRPENGDMFGKFKIGSTVRFSCKVGFELHGSRERICTKNLEWTGSLTTCQDGSKSKKKNETSVLLNGNKELRTLVS